MITTKQAEQIIYAKENMEEAKKILLPHYIEDYGEEYTEVIKKRLERTHFLTESLPDVTFNTLKEFPSVFKSQSDYYVMEEEYFDYLKISKELESLKRRKVNQLYSDYFHLPLTKLNELETDILKLLNMDSFSSKTMNLLLNSKVDEHSKETIKECQEQYIKQCHTLRCVPITDKEKIDYLLAKIKKIQEIYQFQLIKQTMWGKRIVQYFFSEMNIQDIENYDLGNVIQTVSEDLFLPNNTMRFQPCCIGHNPQDSERHGWILFPVARSLDCELNQFFYHEMRHAVEDDTYFVEFYSMLNELRVETHAIKDERVLPSIFTPKENPIKSIYLQMLPYTYRLFEEYGSMFDKWIISTHIIEQERAIKTELLEELDDYFTSVNETFCSFHSFSFNNSTNMKLMIDGDKPKKLVDEVKRGIEKYLAKK